MQKKLIKTEIGGIFFVLVISLFLQNLYALSGNALLSVLFGSANDSIWETLKTLLLPFILWSALELMCLKPRFHKFAAAKIITLYLTGVLYIALCLLFSLFSRQRRSISLKNSSFALIADTCRQGFPNLKITQLTPLPAIPKSQSEASPGPFTTHPITAIFNGFLTFAT